jgi:hypothetical protein
MAIQTKEESQDKFSRRVDKSLKKQTKRKPLSEESWSDLNQRGATLAEQFEWIRLDKIKKERTFNNG